VLWIFVLAPPSFVCDGPFSRFAPFFRGQRESPLATVQSGGGILSMRSSFAIITFFLGRAAFAMILFFFNAEILAFEKSRLPSRYMTSSSPFLCRTFLSCLITALFYEGAAFFLFWRVVFFYFLAISGDPSFSDLNRQTFLSSGE